MKYGDKNQQGGYFCLHEKSKYDLSKRATRLTHVGLTFGQILATKLAFRKARKSEL